MQGTVTGLKPGRCYEFEIVSINQEGESWPTKITDPVITSENTSRPSPPLNVEVAEVRKTSMLLKWSQPLSDGNSPIISYIIEKKETDNGTWSMAVQCSAQDSVQADAFQLEHSVPNLIRGRTYQFRISALNARGISEPSASSNPQLCEAPYRKNT